MSERFVIALAEVGSWYAPIGLSVIALALVFVRLIGRGNRS